MTTEIQDTHFKQLLDHYPGASLVILKPSCSSLITLPAMNLPAGWNRPQTSVRFVISSEYPFACPDCFYGDEGLRLEAERDPHASAVNPIPETDQKGRWFSWHVHERWNPKTDNLLTWVACIVDRLRRVQ